MGLVLDLRRVGEGHTRLEEVIPASELRLEWAGLRFDPEVRIRLDVVRAGNDLDLGVEFEGRRSGECDRCLKPFAINFRGTLRAIGRRGAPDHELAGQDGVVFHDGLVLDLTAEVREAVIVDIPIQSLCSEGCRGLCPSCGADLNGGPCDCRHEVIDPRWAGLRKTP
jgi:uncharacterized protein